MNIKIPLFIFLKGWLGSLITIHNESLINQVSKPIQIIEDLIISPPHDFKINKIIIVEEKEVNNQLIQTLNNFDCLIIDNFNNKINEKIFYSILNQSKQFDNYILIYSYT